MTRRWTWLLPLVAVLLFAAAAERNEALVAMRGRMGPGSGDVLRNAPPLVALTTVAFGGLRGLVADILWLRASRLQEEGEYFELVQLADWITALEPRCSEIWGFHAWNMAYNVSAMMSDSEDRWRWVRSGVELLRDRGLTYSPSDPKMYFELSWLFRNKIGHPLDRSHMFYKHRWAEEMSVFFPGQRADWPAILASESLSGRLRREYRMDPEFMRQMDSDYGPFDWRLPDSHAAYWALRGREAAGRRGSLACDRLLLQALVSSFLQGQLVFRPEEGVFLTTPNMDIFPKVVNAFEEAAAMHGETTLPVAFAGFVREATLILYTFGRREQAQAAFNIMRARTPGATEVSGLEEFVSTNIDRALKNANRERVVVYTEGFFYQGFLWLAAGDVDKAAASDEMARRHWDSYVSAKPPESLRQLALPALDDVRRHAYGRALIDLPPALAQKLRDAAGEGGQE